MSNDDLWRTITGEIFRTVLYSRWGGRTTTTTTIVLRPFVRDYPGELVPEEIFTHPPSWSSSNLYQLLTSTTIHSILPVQIACLTIFLHNLSPRPFWSISWSGALHLIFYTLLHPTHAHTIAACFAVVSILYHLFIVFLSTLYLELLSFTLTWHIHLTILISAQWSATSLKWHYYHYNGM